MHGGEGSLLKDLTYLFFITLSLLHLPFAIDSKNVFTFDDKDCY